MNCLVCNGTGYVTLWHGETTTGGEIISVSKKCLYCDKWMNFIQVDREEQNDAEI